jgi:hypothetical protein
MIEKIATKNFEGEAKTWRLALTWSKFRMITNMINEGLGLILNVITAAIVIAVITWMASILIEKL